MISSILEIKRWFNQLKQGGFVCISCEFKKDKMQATCPHTCRIMNKFEQPSQEMRGVRHQWKISDSKLKREMSGWVRDGRIGESGSSFAL